MAIKRKVKDQKESERKIRRDPQKRPMRMREKRAASLHPISQKMYTSCCKNQFQPLPCLLAMAENQSKNNRGTLG